MIKKTIKILVAAFLFLLPWQTRLIVLPGSVNGGYFEYGTISLYGAEILLWIIVILLIADFFVSKRLLTAAGRGKRITWLVIFTVFYFYLLAFHQNLVTLNYLRIFIEGLILFLILRGMGDRIKFAWVFAPTPKKSDGQVSERYGLNKISEVKTNYGNLLVWGFIAGAALQAALGIYQFFVQYAFASKWLGMAAHDPATLGTYVVEAGGGRWLRAYGALPHPNILAGYLMVAILLLLAIPIIGRATRLLKLAILPILTAGMFFTFSRGAWLALAIGLFVLLVKNRAKIAKEIVIIILTAGCLLFVFWPLVLTRAVATDRLDVKSTSERIGYYGEAWTLIKNHPFLGVGLGNYTRAVHDEIDPARSAYAYQPVHNIFVLAEVELGAVGILLIVIALYVLRKVINWKKLVYLLPFLFIGLFDHYLWSLYPGIILLAVYCGLTVVSD